MINQFRDGQISVLCNHSVLTVGFDAPNTDVIYVTRPVYSPIMLEQIVGRGLRGKKFGGTDECLVVTPQEMLVVEAALGGRNIVLAEDEIRKRLFIED
jgi:superfamily II DNA or RNA helicase